MASHPEHMDTRRPRPARASAALTLALVLCLVALPDDLLSMRPPAPEFPFPASLTPVARQHIRSGGHAVRLPVVAHAVRLHSDRKALHPLDHPLPVRRADLLPGVPDHLRTRVFAVNEPPLPGPASARPAPQAAPAVSATSDPAPAGGMAATSARTSLLVVGDSLSIALADVLERRLAKTPGLAFARLGKISSGLARPDFFDWEANMERLAGQTRPDIVVIMIGTNDNKPLRLASGRAATFGSQAWAEEYRRRAARLVGIARAANPAAQIYWIGAPIMADSDLARDLTRINAVLAREMERIPGCRFVDVWGLLADPRGRYLEFASSPKSIRLRTPDGVHLAPAGAGRLADACLAALAAPAPRVMLSQFP